MNKAELINEVVKLVPGLTKKMAGAALNAICDVIKETLGKEEDGHVGLVGFGTWKVVMRSARTGRNPKTGDIIQIPAKRVVTFVVGKELKEAVENNKNSKE